MSETKQYHINDIFYSLQGEGFYTGTPAVFVRFAGCNLRCDFCDTDFSLKETLTAGQIVSRTLSLLPDTTSSSASYRPLLVLTGGEPALQADDSLLDSLHKAGFYITAETNGTHPLPEAIDWITCSPKYAPVILKRVNELKVVYRGQDVESYYQHIEARHYFLQPCDLSSVSNDNSTTLRDTLGYILLHPHWRLSLQTHKLLHIP